jgi:1-pyrroline-5-carboxylate dehydrogenase
LQCSPLPPRLTRAPQVHDAAVQKQHNPSNHSQAVASYSTANEADINAAIESALAAKPAWESLPFSDRAAIFLKAADLLSGPQRYEIMAATMLGQGKNAWQAEIDAAAELCDFLRFNVKYAQELYAQQPVHNSPNVWNRVEYRALEGFVYAISPFNFTAIGGNLPAAPALMGNVVLWKPSPSAVASNYLVYRMLREAGLPPGVIQFVPGDAERITTAALSHPQLAGLHYTGSTAVFRSLYGKIGAGIAEGRYRGYPRIVGETGGKNFHILHRSADVANAVAQTVRGAFEYQGQKCSATSRVYVPASLAKAFTQQLAAETKKLRTGPPTDFGNFVGPVIHAASFAKLQKAINDASKDPDCEILAGGTTDDSTGYFVHPTVIRVNKPDHALMTTELFGPVLAVYVYPDSSSSSNGTASGTSATTPTVDEAFATACRLVDASSAYGLTGAVFAQDRNAVRQAEDALRNAAGNFYINVKCTGAVVGQQPFGGARASGTNDKAGSQSLLSRFVSIRAVKEEFVPLKQDGWVYPSNLE